MTARERVERARLALLWTIGLAAGLWAAAAWMVVSLLAMAVDLVTPLPFAGRTVAVPMASIAAALAAMVVLWRGRNARSLGRVALYVEERAPELQFALVTANETPPGSAVALERFVETAYPSAPLGAALRRALVFPVLMAAVGALALLAFPPLVRERVLRPRPADVLTRLSSRSPLATRLSPIIVTITPPSYAHEQARAEVDPFAISALVGSRVELAGRGAASDTASVRAARGADALPVTAAGDTWRASLVMPPQPAVLRLADRGYTRLLALEPRADRAPVVTMLAPERDSTYAQPKGALTLAASASDDIGLARAVFELRRTSGGGERFKTQRWLAGGVDLRGARSGSIRAIVRLDTMRLMPGDVLHIRAVATDENTVTGPDSGFSEARTIRIDDPSQRDTLRLAPSAAAPLDTSMLSQRMLIMRAESLLARKGRAISATYGAQARALADRQGQLRARVEELVSTPEVLAMTSDPEEEKREGTIAGATVAQLLHDASRAMVDAESRLRAAAVDDALPHMRRALRFLDRARESRRFFLRGIVPVANVDIKAIRLKGEDSVTAAPRRARPPLADIRHRLLVRLDAVLAHRTADRGPLLDSLTVIRVDALTRAPDAAEPLTRAIDDLRRGRDARPALLAARRRLGRGTGTAPGLSLWRGMP